MLRSSKDWARCRSTTKTLTAQAMSPTRRGPCAPPCSALDALLVVTPEYNGSLPAVLKNAIDWTSRPFQHGAITGKPVAVVGTSHGRYGGVWAHDDTRKSAGIAGARVLEDLTLSVPHAAERFATIDPVDDDEIATALLDILTTLAAAA